VGHKLAAFDRGISYPVAEELNIYANHNLTRSVKGQMTMDKKTFIKLFADLCNVVDKEMGKLTGFAIPDEVPSTSPEARECVKRVLKVLANYGIIIESDNHEQSSHLN
jgi:hypothetical protein